MKYRGITVRLAIIAFAVVVCAALMLAEYGIATAFNMRFEGLTYLEYLRQFYQVPWHAVTGALIVGITGYLAVESVYAYIMKKEN